MRVIAAECALRTEAILGEGPAWHEGKLWWVDIEARRVHCFEPSTGEDCRWQLDARVGFVIPSTRMDFIVGLEGSLARFNPRDGMLTKVADPESHLAGNRFNDAKCDSAGRLWAGTMAVSEAADCGSLYRIDAEWHIDRMVRDVSISNGLSWSTDNRTMYYIDSPTRRVDAFEFDPTHGALANRRSIIDVKDGFPDGMSIDTEGNLWVALWGGWGIACYNPRTGEQVARVELPVEAVTSCCFGGPDLNDLYITTASRDLDTEGHRQQPFAGSIFRARVGVVGPPTQAFAG